MNLEDKIKDIYPYQSLEEEIYKEIRRLLSDFDQSMDPKTFEHTYRQVTRLIFDKYKFLVWGEVQFVFNEISSGNTEMKKVTVINIMNCFSDYNKKKIEKNRIEIENREQEIIKNSANVHKTPYGQAIIFRKEMKEKGITKYDEVPLKELAEKISSGEIKYKYERKKNKRFTI